MLGIDQDVQRKVDAYRSNPQALQQRYAQNQELIDLLALQRIKSEKDAAARQIQMQMQQDPNTIKQQREQELLQRTKQEMMQQTAGVLQNQQQQQQQNLQRVAREGAVTPQGLGALARPPQRMAGGGIVAFQEGGSVDEQIAALREELRKSEALPGYEARRAAILQAIRQLEQEQGGDYTTRMRAQMYDLQKQLQDMQQQRSAAPTPTAAAPAAPAAAPTAAQQPAPATAAQQPASEPPAAVAPETTPAPAGVAGQTGLATPTAAPQAQPAAGIATLPMPKPPEPRSLPTVKAGTLDTPAALEKGTAAASGITAGLEKPVTPVTMPEELSAKTGERYKTLRERLAKIEQEYGDPKEERRRRISAFLRGAGGAQTIGQAFAGASAGMAEEEDKQQKARMEREAIGREIETAEIGTDIDMAKSTMSAAMKAQEIDSANERAAVHARQQFGDAALRAETGRIGDELRADIANLNAEAAQMKAEIDQYDAQVRAAVNQSEAQFRADDSAEARRDRLLIALSKQHTDVTEKIESTVQKAVEAAATTFGHPLNTANVALTNATRKRDPDAVALAKEQIESLEALIRTSTLLTMKSSMDNQAKLKGMLDKLEGGSLDDYLNQYGSRQ